MLSAVPNHRPNGVDALVQPDGRSGTGGYLEVARVWGAGEAKPRRHPTALADSVQLLEDHLREEALVPRVPEVGVQRAAGHHRAHHHVRR